MPFQEEEPPGLSMHYGLWGGSAGALGGRDGVHAVVGSGMPVGPERGFEVEIDRNPRPLY